MHPKSPLIQLAVLSVTIIGLCGCKGVTETKTTPNPVAPLQSSISSPAQATGGVDTGGGNAVDSSAQRPALQEIVEAATNSKKFVKYALNRLFIENELDSDYHTSNYFLSEHRSELETLVDTLKIQLRTDKPCDDFDGSHRDGSVAKMPKNEICISAFSLRPKLTISNFEPQVDALVLHEMSHLVGADEVMAETVQRAALRAFEAFDSRSLLREFRLSRQAVARSISQFEMLSRQDPSKMSLCLPMMNNAETLTSTDRVINQKGLQQLGFHSKSQFSFESGVLTIAALIACSEDKSLSQSQRNDYEARLKVADVGYIGDLQSFSVSPDLSTIEFASGMHRELTDDDYDLVRDAAVLRTTLGWQKAIQRAVALLRAATEEMASTSLAQFAVEISGPAPIHRTDESTLRGNPAEWPSFCQLWIFDSLKYPQKFRDGRIPPDKDPSLIASKIWHYRKTYAAENFSEDLYRDADGFILSVRGRYEPDPRNANIAGDVSFRLFQDFPDGRSLPVSDLMKTSLSMSGEQGARNGRFEILTTCSIFTTMD